MSRYLILFILASPFMILAILSTITRYKLGRINKKGMLLRVSFWVLIIIGLATAQPMYEWLFSHNLTQTESLSLFDVVQATAIILLLFVVNNLMAKVDKHERRLQNLHQELSIKLSEKDNY